jgi:hypothetical protein
MRIQPFPMINLMDYCCECGKYIDLDLPHAHNREKQRAMHRKCAPK